MTERIVVPGRRLGALPTPPAERARNFKLRALLPTVLPTPPPTLDLTHGIPTWPMYANDRLGDCTCAAIGHMLEVWTLDVDGAPRLLQDADIIALYDLVNGGRDTGADMRSVLDAFRKNGLAGDTCLAYAEVNVTDLSEVKTAAWLFDGLDIAAWLCIGNQGQGVWDVVDGDAGAPGSWGGHAINVVGFDDQGGTVITWGQPKRFTWAWWHKYVGEAYAVIPQDFDRLNGRPLANGFNEDQLKADLASLPPTPPTGG